MKLVDSNIIGPFVLQHERYDKKQFDLQLRGSVKAVRVTDRYLGPDDLGEWEVDPDSAGDIHGGQLLKATNKTKREIPMWRFATPMVITGAKSVASGGLSPSKHVCGKSPKQTKMAPIFDADLTPDDRFDPVTLNPPKPKKGKWPKHPTGTVGISLTANDERQQVDLFLPTDGRLIAVNHRGDKDMGSLVFDLNEDFSIDYDRGASLQSAWWVIKKPRGQDFNVLALNIGPSGCEDTEGGYVIDRPTGGTVIGSDRVLGMLSVNQGGFIDVGTGKCRHRRGSDGDGQAIDGAHISTKANFRRNDTEDGPLDFTRYVKPTTSGNVIAPVYCGWRGDVWAWWTKTWFMPPEESPRRPMPTQPVGPRPVVPQPLPEPLRPPIPTGVSTGTPTVPGGLPVFPLPGKITDEPGVPAPTDGGGRTFTTDQPDRQWFTDKDGNVWVREKTPGGNFTPWTIFDEAKPKEPLPWGPGTYEPWFNVISSTVGVAAPVFAAKPQNYSNGMAQGGLVSDPDAADGDMGLIDDDLQDKLNGTTPLTGMLSSFGAQGGTIGSGSSATNTGSTGDPWNYTNKPKTRTRYPSGTASGGWVVHPPETDLRDAATRGMVPLNTSVSSTYMMVSAGAWFGAGSPDLVRGSVDTGFSWGADSSTGDLLFRTHSAGGSPATAFKFTKTTQNICWTSGQSYYGILDHINTAERTWTFPDKSGTVAMTSDIGTGVSALFQQTADGSQTGIVTTASILGTGTGSLTVGAGTLIVGSSIHFVARGYYSTAGVPGNLTVRLNLGGALMVVTAATAFAASMASRYWEFTCDLTVRTTGVTGTIQTHGAFTHLETAGAAGAVTIWEAFRTGTAGVDTTSANALDLVVTMDTAGNTITCTQCIVTKIG